MEALVLSYVITKDVLVSADHFIHLTPKRIPNEKEFINQEIKIQYKMHIKILQTILAILTGIFLLRLGYFWQLLPL